MSTFVVPRISVEQLELLITEGQLSLPANAESKFDFLDFVFCREYGMFVLLHNFSRLRTDTSTEIHSNFFSPITKRYLETSDTFKQNDELLGMFNSDTWTTDRTRLCISRSSLVQLARFSKRHPTNAFDLTAARNFLRWNRGDGQ